MAMKSEKAAKVDEIAALEAEHARETKRLTDAQRAFADLTAELRDHDPDAPAFAKLVASRSAADARCSALAERVERAAAALEAARAAVAAAEQAERSARAAGLEYEIRRLDSELTAKCFALRNELVHGVAEIERLVGEAQELDPQPIPARLRGSAWAGVGGGPVMKLAMGLTS